MREVSIGVREFKARLSEYLRRVKAGQTILITDHGRPVGRVVPTTQTREERLQAMLQIGIIAWSGKKLKPMRPVARLRGNRTVADLLIENRE